MEAIIKSHNYEDYEESFVKAWKNKKDYKFNIGKVGFWYYTIELIGKRLLCYRENDYILRTATLFVKNDVRSLSEEDFESILYEVHSSCINNMILNDFKDE